MAHYFIIIYIYILIHISLWSQAGVNIVFALCRKN